MDFNTLCKHCGFRYGDHKGVSCEYGPVDRCPPQPGGPPYTNKIIDPELRRAVWLETGRLFWGVKDTTFEAQP